MDPLLPAQPEYSSLLTEEDLLPQNRELIAQELLMAEMSGELPLDGIARLTTVRLEY